MVAKEQSEDKTIKPLIAVRLCEYLEKRRKNIIQLNRILKLSGSQWKSGQPGDPKERCVVVCSTHGHWCD